MGKRLFIAEKPSVAQEFAKALHENFSRQNGYQESENTVVTWCVGHLVTMSYPDAYDPELAKWRFETLPFLPEKYKYEIIPNVKAQFNIVKGLLCRPDVETIYICTDSGREGEYIYRLVDMMAEVPAEKVRKRVWIDSQTEEEIKRGIDTAKTWDAYDNLSEAAFLRAKEDYLMGINFSRALSIKYGYNVRKFLNLDKMGAISVGRVMTCVLGMVVRREREIRDFKETPFYRVILKAEPGIEAEFRAVEGSRYYNTPFMYKENGFNERKTAEELIGSLKGKQAAVESFEKKEEKKNPPLLYNLAEAQNDCSRLFKISPDETLKIIQELYEKKLVTYPRTDARVLSTAVSKEIAKNISGLKAFGPLSGFANEILEGKRYVGLAKTRYVDDKKITDHYAIIPTGQGIGGLDKLGLMQQKVYELIARRFLSIFFPPAVYSKDSIVLKAGDERFFASFKALKDEGYFKVAKPPKKDGTAKQDENDEDRKKDDETADAEISTELLDSINKIKKGDILNILSTEIKEGKTSPPKRYTSGSLILTMENAGQFIEDEELRAQIKGSGIGTSATRAEILNKLVNIKYLNLNKKTQIFSPTMLGEIIHEVVTGSISSLLRADLTASWEKGLTQVAEGQITGKEYMEKLESYVTRMTEKVKNSNIGSALNQAFISVERNYK
jgi:DNA topoisomerase-3